MSTQSFEWPCDRRDAHGKHTIVTVATGECDMNCQPDWHADDCGIYDGGETHTECLGVKAHPSTQIGGNHISERPAPLPVCTCVSGAGVDLGLGTVYHYAFCPMAQVEMEAAIKDATR